MKWGTAEPKKSGWYLCTIKDKDSYAIPLFRMEYPANNFSWQGLNHGAVMASIKFPLPWLGEKKL